MSKRAPYFNKTGTTLAICIPTAGRWEPKFGLSLARMVQELERKPLAGVLRSRVIFCMSEGSMLSQGRQSLLAQALRNRADALLFLDDDMTFPPDTAHRLWAHNREFVAAAGCTKTEPPQCVAFTSDLNRERLKLLDLWKRGHPIEVSSVGLACAMVRQGKTLRSTRPPHFLMEWIPDQAAYCGEDTYFCAKWSQAGGEVWIDPKLSLELGHVGRKEYKLLMEGDEE